MVSQERFIKMECITVIVVDFRKTLATVVSEKL